MVESVGENSFLVHHIIFFLWKEIKSINLPQSY